MKWFVPPPAPMTEEVKEILIREHPNGLRVVLDQEFPSDCDAAGDLTGINCEDLATLLLDEPPATTLLQFSEGAPATFASVGRDRSESAERGSAQG